jgi:starvation-inducible outer membrane lipoprotein
MFLPIVMAKGGPAMKLILALSGALLVAGCSSLPTQVADNGGRMVCDKEQMGRVQAKSQGQSARVDVIWLNCPQIRKDQVKT